MQRSHALLRAALTACAVLAVTAASAQQDFVRKSDQPHPFGTGEDQQRLIADICGTQMAALGAEGCGCLAKRAMTGLNEPERDYLILSVVQPPAADRTDTAKSEAELRTIANFLADAGKACAPAGASPDAQPAPGTVTPGAAPGTITRGAEAPSAAPAAPPAQ